MLKCIKLVTVEPAMFLQQAGDTLTFVIFQNLFIDKICRNTLGYGDGFCNLYERLTNDLTPDQEFLRPMMNSIQTASSQFLLYNSLVENCFPVLLVLFLGVWSDRERRRKPPLLLCLMGKMLRSLGLCVNAYFMMWSPVVLIFTTSLFHSLGGGNAVFHMSAFSYIADSSVPRSRTWRLGVAEAFWQLGAPVGLFLGAYLFEQGGYLCVFGTSFTCHLIAVLYTAFILPEVPKPKPAKVLVFGKYGNYGTYTEAPKRVRYYSEHDVQPDVQHFSGSLSDLESQSSTATTLTGSSNTNNNNTSHYLHLPGQNTNSDHNNSWTGNVALHKGQDMEGNSLLDNLENNHSGTSQYLTPYPVQNYIQEESSEDEDHHHHHHHARDGTVYEFIIGSVKAIIRPRPNHTRKCLLSLGAIMLLYGICYYGEANMKYLFTRNKFQWREQEFSAWTIFESIVVVTGLTVVMPIFSKLFKFSDPFAGLIGALARGSSRLCFALAPKSEYLFYGSILDVPGVIGPLSARSLASKCVLSDERGRVFAFLGCIEAIVPLVAVPLYSLIYSNTLTFAPSTIFFLSSGIYFTIFLIFGVLFIALKLNVVQFSGNDLTSLLGVGVGPPEGNKHSHATTAAGVHMANSLYRRSSLS